MRCMYVLRLDHIVKEQWLCEYKGNKYYECILDSKDGEGNWTVNWTDDDPADRTSHPKNM